MSYHFCLDSGSGPNQTNGQSRRERASVATDDDIIKERINKDHLSASGNLLIATLLELSCSKSA